jgi:hypothetical protein
MAAERPTSAGSGGSEMLSALIIYYDHGVVMGATAAWPLPTTARRQVVAPAIPILSFPSRKASLCALCG